MKPTSKGLYLFLMGLGALASTILAQTPGTFTATGNMNTSRYLHTATLLADGRVLIAGGFDDVRGLEAAASAELYDPATGTFVPTGNMTTARSGHTATLLPNGKVLITGGYGPLGTAELYDPSTGTFRATGTMNSPRAVHTATLLADGRVLIAAGLFLTGNTGSATTSAELYDPSTGTFTPTGSLPAPPYGYITATLLADGRVLIGGGTAALYNPRTATFSSAQIPLFQPSAALLMSGKVLLAGGNNDPGESAGAGVYDPSTGTFTDTARMTVARADDPATLLSDGTVLIAGSNGDNGVTLASAELYDPVTGTFTRTGDMTTDRGFHTATLLNNGRILIAGGFRKVGSTSFFGGSSWPPLSSAEVYTPASLIPAPVLLSLSGDGVGQGAIQHAGTYRIASASDPAIAGEYLSIYLTGLADGSVIPPQVAIGGRLAEITFFGNVPGYPGLNVVNVRMPNGVVLGSAVPVRLAYLGRSSNQVTIGVSSSTIVISGVVNAASNLGGAIAPGELVAITGFGLGPPQLVSAAPGSDGLYAAQLAGTTVLINGTPATMIYTSANQIAAVVPDSVSGDTAQIAVTYQGHASASFPVPIAPTAPGIFTQDATGRGHAATINQNGSINTPAHWEGDVMTLFLTGAGQGIPAVAIYGSQQLPIAQGTVPGVMQIKVPIPRGTDCDLPVVFRVGKASSQAGVTIAVDLCI